MKGVEQERRQSWKVYTEAHKPWRSVEDCFLNTSWSWWWSDCLHSHQRKDILFTYIFSVNMYEILSRWFLGSLDSFSCLFFFQRGSRESRVMLRYSSPLRSIGATQSLRYQRARSMQGCFRTNTTAAGPVANSVSESPESIQEETIKGIYIFEPI